MQLFMAVLEYRHLALYAAWLGVMEGYLMEGGKGPARDIGGFVYWMGVEHG